MLVRITENVYVEISEDDPYFRSHTHKSLLDALTFIRGEIRNAMLALERSTEKREGYGTIAPSGVHGETVVSSQEGSDVDIRPSSEPRSGVGGEDERPSPLGVPRSVLQDIPDRAVQAPGTEVWGDSSRRTVGGPLESSVSNDRTTARWPNYGLGYRPQD